MKTLLNNLLSARLLGPVLLLLPLLAGAADISVSVDRNPVNVDESFQIIFTASETPDANPDFSPLDKDFIRGAVKQSHSTSWANGKTSQTSKWMVSVLARLSGSLQIPPIPFGKDSSPALPIVVRPSPTGNQSIHDDAELFLDVSAAPENPYVQAQVIYTLKLYTRVDLAQAYLTEPELPDAVIEKLGEDSSYNSQVNGVDYSVTERSYAVFPQKSGTMTIKPLELTADVVVGSQPSFNSFFGSPFTRSKQVKSKPVTLNVRPQPASFTGGHWLPAEQLELQQQWSGDTQNMQVGEPLTRTLTLTAWGTSVGQLPELNAGDNADGIKIYPDQPLLNEQKAAGGMIAQRQEKLAFMPNKPGTYTLPKVAIPWFNTVTEKMEWATVPEMAVTVVGEAQASAPEKPAMTGNSVLNPPKTAASLTTATGQTFFWPALSAFLATGWLLTGVFFWLKAQPKTPVDDTATAAKTRQDDAVTRLRQACQANDAVAAKNALLDWGRGQYGEGGLGAIARHCEARLRDEIMQLEQTLYGKKAQQSWQGKALFQAFSEHKARKTMAGRVDSPLKPLYPS